MSLVSGFSDQSGEPGSLYVNTDKVRAGDILFLPEDGWYHRTREEEPLSCLKEHLYLVIEVFRSNRASPGHDRAWVSVVRQPCQKCLVVLDTNQEVTDLRHGQSDLRPAEPFPYTFFRHEQS